MKKIKKMLSIMLAMAMTLAMSVTAFAGSNTLAGKGSFTITIKDEVEGYKYAAYQIFSGDLAEENGTKTLSNIVWGSGVDKAKAEKAFPGKTAAEVAKSIEGKANDSQEAKDFAAAIAECLAAEPTAQTDEMIANEYVLSGLTAGYYLVENLSVPTTDGAYTRYILEVVGNVAPTPKRDIPTPDKKIVDNGEKVSANEASIGDEVNYEITGTMPSNINDYKEYYYLFTDTLSKGLTFKPGSIHVTVNGKDVTSYFSTEEYPGDEAADPDKEYAVGKYDPENGTQIKVGINNLKGLSAIDGLDVGEITAQTTVVLTYTATLNENAVIAGDGNVNDVKLTYSNNPNNSGDGSTEPPENPDVPKPEHPTGESPKVEVVTYTTELTILKTDEAGAFLPGVEFTLTGQGVNVVLVTTEEFTEAAEGAYWKLKDNTYTTTAPTIADDETDNSYDYASTEIKYTKTTTVTAKGTGKTDTNVVGTVNADGTVTFQGLGAGDYKIEETKTLAGYNTIEPIEFTLTFDATKKPMFTSSNEKVTVGEDNKLDTSIENKKGSLLPSTGGIGTTIFYIVGAVLVIGAAILLVTKKRMSKEEIGRAHV